MVVDEARKQVQMSMIFKWYRDDFGKTERDVWQWCSGLPVGSWLTQPPAHSLKVLVLRFHRSRIARAEGSARACA